MLSVSFAAPAIQLAPGVAAAEVSGDIARLSGLTPVYKWIEKRLHADAIWFITALDSGVASIYPGNGNIPRGVDQRDQPWYRHAVADDPIPWSGQYVDPATRQIVVAATLPLKGEKGEVVGAVAVVIPISRLLEQKFLADKIPNGTQSFLCYLDTDPLSGNSAVRVYATEEDATPTHRSWRTQVDDMWLTADDPDQFEAMMQDFETGTPGIRRMPYQGCDCLWAYGYLKQFTSFLVFITPFEKILKPAVDAEVAIQKQVDDLIRFTGFGAAAVLLVVFFLAMAFSRTVTRPLNELAKAAQRLADGDFDTRVDIRSRDEIGEMGRVFNTVGPRLKEHAKMRQSLSLAREVQQTLLPKTDPGIPGLDIAGKSFNCDETGGDYYDYLPGQGPDSGSIAVLVGDVSGHGISSALLMTTARALIRQRAAMGGSMTEIVSDVNRQLTKDIEASGSFMTLFYGLFDPKAGSVRWVRAGHDPAIFYDPSGALFEELEGKGLALGVLEPAEFEACERPLRPGNIVIIGTDGIWEARNPDGDMFGKESGLRHHRSPCRRNCGGDSPGGDRKCEKFSGRCSPGGRYHPGGDQSRRGRVSWIERFPICNSHNSD